MSRTLAELAGLAVTGGLSLNLTLQFALGFKAAPLLDSRRRPLPLPQIAWLFLAVFVLWLAYAYALWPLPGGFLEYFAAFPLSALACVGLERAETRLFPGLAARRRFPALTAYDGLAPASLILTTRLALNPVEAAVIALSFALGVLLSILIQSEIQRRAALERVPRYLRGSPLALVSLGLLALVFASAAGILFRVIETGVF